MKTIGKTMAVQSPLARPAGRVDVGRLEATGEAEIDWQRAEDDADALRDAARFARRVRRRLGFSQAEFAARIGGRVAGCAPAPRLGDLGSLDLPSDPAIGLLHAHAQRL